MQHDEVQWHMHLRRRAHRGNSIKHAYPSSSPLIRRVDTLMFVVGIIGPLVSVPQLIKIFGEHTVSGISIASWFGYIGLTLLWLLYGLVHKERPIIITQALWLVVNIVTVIGAIIYR